MGQQQRLPDGWLRDPGHFRRRRLTANLISLLTVYRGKLGLEEELVLLPCLIRKVLFFSFDLSFCTRGDFFSINDAERGVYVALGIVRVAWFL
jgi:hypothetical protein